MDNNPLRPKRRIEENRMDADKPKPRTKSGRGAVTVTDIAQACGVSRATVSLVLRGSPLVNIDTRARVEAELKRQRYVYNRAAANLRKQTSSSVALVINDLSNPFFAEFAAGVDEALGAGRYVTLLGSTAESPQRQQAVLESLVEHAPAGIILSPAEHSDAIAVQRVLGSRMPVLVFNRELAGHDWDFLALDNQRGARRAAEHLHALGHRRIAFFGGHSDSSSCRQRREGYLEALRGVGIEPEPGWLVESSPTRVDAAVRTAALFAQAPDVTAAVCYNDNVALGLMLGLRARGLQPGMDFALTGFDDISEAALSTPPLTTLAVKPRACGRMAAEMLLERVRDPDAPPRRAIAPVQLVVRGSCGEPQS